MLLLICCLAQAQPGGEGGKGKGKRGGGPTPGDIGENPQDIGEAGVAWYTTWETGTGLHQYAEQFVLDERVSGCFSQVRLYSN